MGKSFGDGNISEQNCNAIYDAVKMGLKVTKVTRYYGVHRSTVYGILKRVEGWRAGRKGQKRGARPKLNVFALKRLEDTLIRHRFKPMYMICNIFNKEGSISISKRRLRRYIHKLTFNNYRAVSKPYVRPPNILKRQAFAIHHWHYNISQWARVLFTDESPFHVRPIRRNVRVWRREHERLKLQCMLPTFKSGRKSIQVWGGFSFHGRTKLYWIKGKFKAESYKSLLESFILPEANRIFGNLTNFVLQDDNCPAHKSKDITNFLLSKNVNRMKWPAQSPDLNPIENAWGHIKRILRNRTDYAKNEVELFEIVQKEWNELPQHFFQELVGSMANRLYDVIQLKGGPTKY